MAEESTFDRYTYGADTLCECGHIAHYHSGGYGDCQTCDCRGFIELGNDEKPAYLAGVPADDVADKLASALERTLNNFQAILAQRPVRDVAETFAEADAALAAYEARA